MADGDAPRFEFATAQRIIFGAGRSSELPQLARDLGRRTLLVTGRDTARFPTLVAALRAAVDELILFPVTGEPTVELADAGARLARDHRIDVVIALGGGSVIDAGKTIAALAANAGSALDYLEVVGRGQPLHSPSLPFIATPTTAGTGAEVTRNAVLSVEPQRVKASLRSAHLLPRLALVDPVLTLDLPAAHTAATGLDALTQLIEPYLSPRANPLTDALCRDGIPRAARALRVAFREPRNLSARADLSLAALYSGLALANAGLGAVHGFAAAIGGEFRAPHGAICAALLPHVLDANLAALRVRAPHHPALGRLEDIARWLTGAPDALADAAVRSTLQLVHELEIPPLSHWGIRREHLGALVEKAMQASSMKANALPLTAAELMNVLEAALAV